MTKLVVAEIPEDADRDFSVEQTILGPQMEVRRFTYVGDDTSLVSACVDADVILTPHVAFYSDASILESRTVSANNIRIFLDGNHAAVRQYVHHAIN